MLLASLSQVLRNGSPSAQLQKASHDSGLSVSDQEEMRAKVCRLSFMSDVYSFGIVVWEVLSREVRITEEPVKCYIARPGCWICLVRFFVGR